MSKSTRPRVPVNPGQLTLDEPIAWVVYVLADPRVSDPMRRIRYVGVTKRTPRKRYLAHLSSARRGEKTHKANWIRSLLAEGECPTLEIIDYGVSQRSWDGSEIAWIRYFCAAGCPLTNATDGGDGARGYVASEETKAKISAANKGKNTGPRPKEIGRRISAAKQGKKIKLLQGRKLTEEHKQAVSNARKGKPLSAEHRAKLSISHMGIKQTPEQSKKKSESLKKAWAIRKMAQEKPC